MPRSRTGEEPSQQTAPFSLRRITNDVITGLRGKAFFGDGHIFVPYYIDFGTSTGVNNQTWEGMTGAGYAFNHGQTVDLYLPYAELLFVSAKRGGSKVQHERTALRIYL